jgi:ATPase family associated with various cellular activities (AAA)
MNAHWPLANKTITSELWVTAGISWFGKTRLQAASAIFSQMEFDTELAHHFSWSIQSFAEEFSKIELNQIELPAHLYKVISGLSLEKQDVFLLLLCTEIENNYWLNLAIQELQGPQENTYPKVHLVCELISALFAVRMTPTNIASHYFVEQELLLMQTAGPVALASMQINKDIWYALNNPKKQPQHQPIHSYAIENQLVSLVHCHSSKESISHLVVKHQKVLDYFALEFRLKKISQLNLYAPLAQGFLFAQGLADKLDLVPVVLDKEWISQPKKLFWLSHALDWLPVVLTDHHEDSIQELNIPIVTIATHKKSKIFILENNHQNRIAEYSLPSEGYAERFAIWSEWLDANLADHFAKRWLMSSAAISAIMKQVEISRRTLEEDSVEKQIIQARLDLAPTSLQELAVHLPDKVHHKAIVFPKQVDEELNRLLQRCQNREIIFTELGYSLASGQHKGVKALFSGESGTGKTLAASYVASQLGIPIYRMDLGSILNKYIGETEKNITRVMDEACNQDFIILIDEADALFGKRTDAETSGERFANMLTNYLLSRIEQYSGIVLMTTNGISRIDTAFMRRLDMIIEFNTPELEERAGIWQSHLGNRSPGEHYCRQLASLCDLTGGYIRNAVLAAAAELPHAQDSILPYALLLRALANEYRKSGKPIPPKLTAQITATLPKSGSVIAVAG